MTVWSALCLLPFAMLLGVSPAHAAPNLCAPAPTGLPPLPSTLTLPSLPQTCYQPPFPTPTSTVNVNTSADLQNVLTNAVCGEQIVVQAGVTYVGSFTTSSLACPANNPVLVVSSALSSLPPYTLPAQSLAGGPSVPTIECNVPGCAALSVADNASGWYFAGLEFTMGPNATTVYPIVVMGSVMTEQPPTVANLPHYITFDRCLVHPNAELGGNCQTGGSNCVTAGIDLNAAYGTVMYSNIWGIVNTGFDTQAIGIDGGAGPFLIAGNYLESSGENLILITGCNAFLSSSPVFTFGYLYPWGIPTCPIAADVTIRLNHFHKQAAWMTNPFTGVPCSPVTINNGTAIGCYDVKNELEIKSDGERVLIDSNWFDTTFSDGQHQFFIANCGALIYPPQQHCNDVTFTNNLFEHGPEVWVFNGDETAVWQPNTAYTVIMTMAGEGVYTSVLDPAGHFQQAAQSGTSGAAMPVWNDNGGTTTDGTVVWQDEGPAPTGMRFMFRNNLAVDISGNTWGQGSYGWAFQAGYAGDLILDHNTIINTPAQPPQYPPLGWTEDPPQGELNLWMTNNLLFGPPFSTPQPSPSSDNGSPGPTIAAIPNPTFGGDAFVGDWWPNWSPQVVSTPPYPPGISTVVSSGGCANANYSVGQCWQPDWDLVGMTDFTGANAGTEGDLAGAALSPSSPFHNTGTDGLDVGVNVPALLAALNPVFNNTPPGGGTTTTIQPPTNLTVVVY